MVHILRCLILLTTLGLFVMGVATVHGDPNDSKKPITLPLLNHRHDSNNTQSDRADAKNKNVRLLSLMVRKKAPKGIKSSLFDNKNGFSYSSKKTDTTALGILLRIPEKRIVDFDLEASQLLKFSDDLGTDFKRRTRIDPRPIIASDTEQCVINVTSYRVPAPGATKLLLNANLVFRCASGEKITTIINPTTKNGGRFILAGTDVKISKMKYGSFFTKSKDKDSESTVAVFTIEAALDVVKSVEFHGPDGKTIKQSLQNTSTTFINDKSTTKRTYSIAEQPDPLSVKITQSVSLRQSRRYEEGP